MDQSSDTKREALESLKGMTPTQVNTLIGYLAELTAPIVAKALPDAIAEAIGPSVFKAMKQLGYTEDVAGLVQILAARSGDSREDIMKKALTLYGLALDARERGNRLAILNPEDEIVQEITGFEAAEMQPVS